MAAQNNLLNSTKIQRITSKEDDYFRQENIQFIEANIDKVKNYKKQFQQKIG